MRRWDTKRNISSYLDNRLKGSGAYKVRCQPPSSPVYRQAKEGIEPIPQLSSDLLTNSDLTTLRHPSPMPVSSVLAWQVVLAATDRIPDFLSFLATLWTSFKSFGFISPRAKPKSCRRTWTLAPEALAGNRFAYWKSPLNGARALSQR